MKKPVVDYETCIGCGSCVELCPEVFELRNDEKAWVIALINATPATVRRRSMSVLSKP